MTYFYCTGFGKFGQILHNPTSKLIEALPALLNTSNENNRSLKLKHHEIITVAIQDCDEAINRIYEMVCASHGEADRHIIINFGVADGRPAFTLETLGKNCKIFSIPDERGNTPVNEAIDTEQELTHKRYSSLKLTETCEVLKSKGHNVECG